MNVLRCMAALLIPLLVCSLADDERQVEHGQENGQPRRYRETCHGRRPNCEDIFSAYQGWPQADSLSPVADHGYAVVRAIRDSGERARDKRGGVQGGGAQREGAQRSKILIREPPEQAVISRNEARMGVAIEIEPERPLAEGLGFPGFDLWLDAKLEFSCVGQDDATFFGTLARAHVLMPDAYVALSTAICVRTFIVAISLLRSLAFTPRGHAHHYSRAVRSYVRLGPQCPRLLRCNGPSACEAVLPCGSRE